ncbi:vitellogenin-2-like [Abrus precatorius]|uniref:Vitellogenin-2-like n=1 Tax=Abrus precatorius TaxID=3816 RepID=A0A8B8JQ13_ABRPR|nr:vitellogenin-2-like [Abrus precatorius]
MGDGMQCSDHPFRNNPGGICAFCLQEKLGKLVSSSFPLPIRASSSSSSSPSFTPASSSSSLSLSVNKNATHAHYHEYYTRRTRLPFLSAKKKKKKPSPSANTSSASGVNSDIILKRSKSTATPRRGHSLVDADDDDIVIEDFSPRKRNGFWSFLYLSSKSSKNKDKCCSGSSLGRKSDIVVEEDNSPNTHTTASASASASSLERKVSRSRSVGCGSRSFSGDFFERISTGFGDCTLRRVESQREGKPKVSAGGAAMNRGGDHHHHHHHHCMKERVRCGGLFGGFMMTSSSSSSSSSSYWVSSADDAVNGKSASVALSHSRGRSWGWAFASPMRAFTSKPSSKDNRRDIIRDANDKNATPNLSAIPSLLAVRG